MAGVILDDALRRMAQPWRWGVTDCCTAACDLFAELHGIDPMAPLRGGYQSETEARALIRRHGGFLRMCATLADSARLLAGDGSAGEIGCARPRGSPPCLALCIGFDLWVAKSPRGALIGKLYIERSWRAPPAPASAVA